MNFVRMWSFVDFWHRWDDEKYAVWVFILEIFFWSLSDVTLSLEKYENTNIVVKFQFDLESVNLVTYIYEYLKPFCGLFKK